MSRMQMQQEQEGDVGAAGAKVEGRSSRSRIRR